MLDGHEELTYFRVWRILDKLVDQNSLTLLVVGCRHIVDGIPGRIWHVGVPCVIGTELAQLAIGLDLRDVMDSIRMIGVNTAIELVRDLGDGRLARSAIVVQVRQLGLGWYANNLAIVVFCRGDLAGGVGPLEAKPLERVLGAARHGVQRCTQQSQDTKGPKGGENASYVVGHMAGLES